MVQFFCLTVYIRYARYLQNNFIYYLRPEGYVSLSICLSVCLPVSHFTYNLLIFKQGRKDYILEVICVWFRIHEILKGFFNITR